MERMKSSLHILVVDSDATMRGLLEKTLVRDGYNVRTAEDGEEALTSIRQEPVDIVVADMKLPRLSGLELLRIVRREAKDIGIVLTAARGDLHAVKDALLLGADEYIVRPFKSPEVSLVVDRVYWRIISEQRRQPTADQSG
jgi:DNA-binding response OmpR family regulator